MIEKILACQIIPLDITIEQGLTLPTEHFHGDDRTTAGLEEAMQHGECRLDMEAVVMLFAEIDDLLLEETAFEFFNGQRLAVRRVDDLSRAEHGGRPRRRSG